MTRWPEEVDVSTCQSHPLLELCSSFSVFIPRPVAAMSHLCFIESTSALFSSVSAELTVVFAPAAGRPVG